jgi:hypothetical protein
MTVCIPHVPEDESDGLKGQRGVAPLWILQLCLSWPAGGLGGGCLSLHLAVVRRLDSLTLDAGVVLQRQSGPKVEHEVCADHDCTHTFLLLLLLPCDVFQSSVLTELIIK